MVSVDAVFLFFFAAGIHGANAGYWKVTGRIDFKILISNFWPLGEGFRGFRPQIRLQHAKIYALTSFEIIFWLQLQRFTKFCPVAFQYPVIRALLFNICANEIRKYVIGWLRLARKRARQQKMF